MNTELTKEIIRNIDLILAPSLISGNFPFDKNSIQKTTLTKGYLMSHIFQNRVLGAMSSRSPSPDCKGIMIGSLSKTYKKENGEIGDHSNLFLKNYLNKNGIKTAEILIPNLRDIILFKYLFKVKSLAKNNSFILPYLRQREDFNIDKLDLKNKLLARIKKIRKLGEVYTFWQSSTNLDFIEKNIEKYVNFIGSKEFAMYLSTIALGLDNLFKIIKPEFIVTNSLHGNRDRLAIFVAHKHNIKVLFVPHGIGGSLNIPQYIKEDKIPVDVYASAIYSVNDKRKICGQKEIWYLGPLWLGYLLEAREKDVSIRETDRPVVLYVSQPFSRDNYLTKEEHLCFLIDIFRIFKELEIIVGVKWIIKLHPRDNANLYKEALKRAELKAKFIQKPSPISIENLQKLKPSIIVSAYSTFAIEMIILKKVVVGLFPYLLKEKFFSDSGHTKSTIPLDPESYTEQNLQDFKKLILEFFNDEEKKEEKRSRQERLMTKEGIWLNQGSLKSFSKFLNDFIDRK